jgi:hypothetical protein
MLTTEIFGMIRALKLIRQIIKFKTFKTQLNHKTPPQYLH